MLETQEAIQRSRAALMRSFWAVTLPGALDQAFTMMEAPVAASLRVLELLADGYR
jgi:hypothetical protein